MASVGSLFATIGADSSGFQKGMGAASSSLQGFGKDILKQAVGIASLTTAITTAGRFVADSVKDWSAYNIAMDKGSIATGLAADEYSRLIQAADDARVSQESMTKAMEMATKNGYAMSIESLGQIADKLNAIKDPAEKAKTASEIFGRQWADIMPFLDKGSAGIEALTSAIDDNMIATDKSIESAQDYATQVDSLSDAWTGFRNEIGMAVMPALTDVMTGLVDQITQIKELKKNMDLLKDAEDAGTITHEQYADAAMAGKWSVEAGVYATDKLTKATESSNAKIDDGSDIMRGYAQSAAVMKAFTEGSAEAQEELAKQSSEAAAKIREQITSVFSLDKNFSSIVNFATEYTAIQEQINAKQAEFDAMPGWKKTSADAKQLLGDIDDLKQGYTKLANKMTLDMFQATIAIGGVTDAEMSAYLGMAVEMGFISQQGADAATAAYNDAIGKINAMAIDEKTGNVVVDAAAAFAAFDLIESYAFATKVVRVQMSLGAGGMSSGPWDERAEGGPVTGGSPYLVGERGPELFVPESSGQIIPNNQMAGQGAGVTNIYNLSMPTTANPGDVRMAFELMEAWA